MGQDVKDPVWKGGCWVHGSMGLGKWVLIEFNLDMCKV